MKGSCTLRVLSDRLSICRLPAEAPVPEWAMRESVWSVTRTSAELSIVCPEAVVPGDIHAEPGWLSLHVLGPLPLTMTGVLASLADPLADAGIAIFAISTFDSDIILVRGTDLDRARAALSAAGHRFL